MIGYTFRLEMHHLQAQQRLQVVFSDMPRAFTFIAGQLPFQAPILNTSITMVFTTSGTLNMTGGSINLTGYYSSYGQGVYAATGSTSSLKSATIIHCKNGIQLETNATVNLTSCIVTTNIWPVYYSGAGTLTISGVCDFTGNTVNAFYVNHSTHTGTWTLPTAAVPYYMYNGYTVANGSTMIIGSQNILKFRIYTTFDIRGTLTADVPSVKIFSLLRKG